MPTFGTGPASGSAEALINLLDVLSSPEATKRRLAQLDEAAKEAAREREEANKVITASREAAEKAAKMMKEAEETKRLNVIERRDLEEVRTSLQKEDSRIQARDRALIVGERDLSARKVLLESKIAEREKAADAKDALATQSYKEAQELKARIAEKLAKLEKAIQE